MTIRKLVKYHGLNKEIAKAARSYLRRGTAKGEMIVVSFALTHEFIGFPGVLVPLNHQEVKYISRAPLNSEIEVTGY